MAASVNLPPAEQLPPRPSAADVEDALDFATAGRPDGPLRILAAELLHLRAELEVKGGELGGLTYHAQEVTRAWMHLHPTQRADTPSDLAAELDELAEIGGAS